MPAGEAARHLFALRQAPEGLARGSSSRSSRRRRLVWRGGSSRSLAAAGPAARGGGVRRLRPRDDRALDRLGADLRDRRRARPRARDGGDVRDARRAGRAAARADRPADRAHRRGAAARAAGRAALRRFSAFAGDAVLVAHNARFDVGFVNRELERLTGKRLSATVIDTVSLARNLLARPRASGTSLASLAYFFGTSREPCHRALPDAQATAEVFVRLIGLAQERGARRVAELRSSRRRAPRRVHGKRPLAHGAPPRPGVYLFRDRHEPGALRRQGARPARAAALVLPQRAAAAVGRGGARRGRADRVARARLGARGGARGGAADPRAAPAGERAQAGAGALRLPAPARGRTVVGRRCRRALGPLRRRAHAERAARALAACSQEEFDDLLEGAPLPRLRARLADLADCLRYEDAARLRDRIAALEGVIEQLARLERLRAVEACLLAPALEPGWLRAFFVAGGRVFARARPSARRAARVLEVEAGSRGARRRGRPSLDPGTPTSCWRWRVPPAAAARAPHVRRSTATRSPRHSGRRGGWRRSA